MRSRILVPVAAAIALALAGCEGQGSKQTGGTVLGGVGGAVAGAQFGSGKGQLVATALGTLAGAFLGSEIGKSLDNADRAAIHKTSQNSLETAKSGETASWSNPDSGHSGTVTPTRTYQAASGDYCREYEQTVTIGGKTERAYGTACRQPDGTWKIVK